MRMTQTPTVGRKKLNRVKRNITLPAELAKAADAHAADRGRHLSHVIEDLLVHHLENEGVEWQAKPSGRRDTPAR